MTTSPLATSTDVDASTILARVRELTEPVLRATVDRLEPWLAMMSAYHLGWRTVEGRPTPGMSGKLVRPALAVLAAEAVGADARVALPGAAAVELVHNFSLVHDDIMDGDEQRRGRPSVWHAYGSSAAIMVGDALQALAFDLIGAVGEDSRDGHDDGRGARAGRLLNAAMLDLVTGQAQDLKFPHRSWQGNDAVTVAEYQAMAGAKTGSLLGAAAAIGAELGGAQPDVVSTFDRIGRHLGLAFQCVDDILGIWGDPEITGKPVLGDLREGKKTLPILGALAAKTRVAVELRDALVQPVRSNEWLRHIALLIERAGGRAFTEEQATSHLDQARTLLARLSMPVRVSAEFDVLIDALTDRVR
ncbi:MAG TPA: polyprenyl synthetase family protein [Pseudonocardiaceae bacterium]|jgi:geranylgeranyl diphosphate synthase type I|nr:polyprenyl synthetase family protein [Pseudonocardiaceae bacterium]